MNYILLFPDEMRAESLGCYGHPLVKTPNIDRLAREGSLFEQNYTTHPVCGPSRCNLVSSWYPHVDGRRTYYMMKDSDSNFITPLKKAGFHTCHCGKDDMFDQESMKKVFDEFQPFLRRDITKNYRALPDARYSMLYPPVPDLKQLEIGDEAHTNGAIDYIRRKNREKEPFFLMLSFMNPHPPYTAPEKYYTMYDPSEVKVRTFEWCENKPDLYQYLRRYRETESQTEDFFKQINAVYLGMITYVDDLIGRVLDALREEGIYEETTIILCSDHGDYAGDAGQLEKWPSDMSDMITRVPLIIRRPGEPKGLRISTPTQSFDIFPTIFDFEELNAEHAHFGKSLRQQIEGGVGDAERSAYCEGGYDTREPYCFEPACFAGTPLDSPMQEGTDYYPKCLQQQELPDTVCRVVMQRYQKWKLVVRTNHQNELYDMDQDPFEYRNLYQDESLKGVRNELMQRMLDWMIHTSDVVPRLGR